MRFTIGQQAGVTESAADRPETEPCLPVLEKRVATCAFPRWRLQLDDLILLHDGSKIMQRFPCPEEHPADGDGFAFAIVDRLYSRLLASNPLP
jgi:hypothetical protein